MSHCLLAGWLAAACSAGASALCPVNGAGGQRAHACKEVQCRTGSVWGGWLGAWPWHQEAERAPGLAWASRHATMQRSRRTCLFWGQRRAACQLVVATGGGAAAGWPAPAWPAASSTSRGSACGKLLQLVQSRCQLLAPMHRIRCHTCGPACLWLCLPTAPRPYTRMPLVPQKHTHPGRWSCPQTL